MFLVIATFLTFHFFFYQSSFSPVSECMSVDHVLDPMMSQHKAFRFLLFFSAGAFLFVAWFTGTQLMICFFRVFSAHISFGDVFTLCMYRLYLVWLLSIWK